MACEGQSPLTLSRFWPGLRSRLSSAGLLLLFLYGPITSGWTQSEEPSASDFIALLSESLAVLETQVSELEQRLNERGQQLRTSETQLRQLETQLIAAERELETAWSQLSVLETELTQTVSSLEQWRDRSQQLDTRLSDLQQSYELQISSLMQERDDEARRANAERWKGRLEGALSGGLLVTVVLLALLF